MTPDYAGSKLSRFLLLYAQIVGVLALMVVAVLVYKSTTLGLDRAFARTEVSVLLSWFGLMLAFAIPVALLILIRERLGKKK